jgi:hypothetical protein
LSNGGGDKIAVRIRRFNLEDEKILLKFLERTKEGKYAIIEISSLPYSRIQETRAIGVCEELYRYIMT